MNRPDAFRELHTLCQRFDEVKPATFPIVPFRAYLFGSVLTDKPDPTDIDVILVYDQSPFLDVEGEIHAITNHLPLAHEKALIELRRGMKMMHLYMVEFDLGEWEQRDLLLFTQPRLIWKPNRDWRSALARLEASPLPWAGPLPDNAVEISEAYIRSLSTAEYYTRFRQAIKEIEQQQI